MSINWGDDPDADAMAQRSRRFKWDILASWICAGLVSLVIYAVGALVVIELGAK